jgi:hypothetical protein
MGIGHRWPGVTAYDHDQIGIAFVKFLAIPQEGTFEDNIFVLKEFSIDRIGWLDLLWQIQACLLFEFLFAIPAPATLFGLVPRVKVKAIYAEIDKFQRANKICVGVGRIEAKLFARKVGSMNDG